MMCNKIFIFFDFQVCARVFFYNFIYWYFFDFLLFYEGEEILVLFEICYSKQFIEFIQKVDEEFIDILYVNLFIDLFIIGM